jgi:hypothetical protein
LFWHTFDYGTHIQPISDTIPVKVESPALPGTSPVCGKRIIARVEASTQGTDTRLVVTSL